MTTIANGTITPARNAPRRRLRRAHPVIAAALVAVTVAAGCVGGASAWREHASARRLELARWQTLAGPAGDAQALAALRRAAAGKEAAAQTALGEALLARADAALRGRASTGCGKPQGPGTRARISCWARRPSWGTVVVPVARLMPRLRGSISRSPPPLAMPGPRITWACCTAAATAARPMQPRLPAGSQWPPMPAWRRPCSC
ncbi:hypothetical protein ACU4GI_17235 [Cupriavidus basilensis]